MASEIFKLDTKSASKNLKDFEKQLQAFSKSVEGVGETLEKALSGPIEKITSSEEFTNLFGSFTELPTALEESMNNAVENTILPALANIQEALSPVTEGLSAWIGENEGLMGIAGTFGAILAALTPLLGGIQSFIELLPVIQSAISALSSPVGIAALAIAGLTTAFVHFYTTNEEFAAKVDEITGNIAQAFSGMGDDVSKAWSDIKEGAGTAFDQLKTTLGSAKDNLGPIVSDLWNTVTGEEFDLDGKMGLVKEMLGTTWENLGIRLSGVWDSMNLTAQTVFGEIGAFWDSHGESIQNTFSNVWEQAWVVVEPIWRAISDVSQEVFGGFKDFFDENVGGVGEVFRQAFEIIWIKIEPVINDLSEKIQFVFNALSLFWETWGDNITTYIGLIIERFSIIFHGIVDVVSGILDIIIGLMTGDWERAFDGAKKIVEGFVDMVIGLFNNFKEKISNVIEGIKDGVVLVVEGIVTFITEKVPEIIQNVLTWFSELPGKLGTALGELVGTILQTFTDIKENIKEKLGEALTTTKEWLSDMFKKIFEEGPKLVLEIIKPFTDLASKLGEKLNEAFDSVKQWFVDLFAHADTESNSVVEKIVLIFTGLKDKFLEIGKNIINSLWEGIWSKWDWLKGKMGEFVDGFKKGVESKFGGSSSSSSSKPANREQIISGRSVFHSGGIFGSLSSMSEGLALLQSGEMILTRSQQAQLFNLANGKSTAAGASPNVHVYLSVNDAMFADSRMINMLSKEVSRQVGAEVQRRTKYGR